MDLSPRQRVLAFVVIVVLLGGTGAYLLIPGVRAALGQGPPASPAAHRVRPPVADARRRSRASAPSSSAAPTAPAPSAPNIYAWLPFSQSDLAKAAGVTEAFGAAYDTFSYRESAAAYVAPMRNLATTELTGSLARGLQHARRGQPAGQAEAGVHGHGGDQLAAQLRRVQPHLRGHHQPAAAHHPGQQPGQLAVGHHRGQQRRDLAGQ